MTNHVLYVEWNVYEYLEVIQPGRLFVVLGGEDAGVEEDQGHDQPEHELGLAHLHEIQR